MINCLYENLGFTLKKSLLTSCSLFVCMTMLILFNFVEIKQLSKYKFYNETWINVNIFNPLLLQKETNNDIGVEFRSLQNKKIDRAKTSNANKSHSQKMFKDVTDHPRYNPTTNKCNRMILNNNRTKPSIVVSFGQGRTANQLCYFSTGYALWKEYGIQNFIDVNQFNILNQTFALPISNDDTDNVPYRLWKDG